MQILSLVLLDTLTVDSTSIIKLSADTKTLIGTITDSITHAAISGATVSIRDFYNNIKVTGTTDAAGLYSL